ncbi:MAG: TerC family protein [Jiangellales bacterium]
MLDVPLAVWAATIAGIILLLAIDFVVGRNPHDVSMREATLWSVFYVGIAIAFGIGVWTVAGGEFGQQYFAAWLVEKSLSVDNLFIFLLIFARFAVPSELQQRALLIGVALALVMRAAFIAVGAAALEYFAFTFVIFGAFLIWTAWGIFKHRNEDADLDENAVMRFARKRFRVTTDFHGNKLSVRHQGRRYVTPMFLVLIAIGTTDLLFALDSIPATFGVTQIPYLVFAANAFALLGLRALFFVLHNLLDKLVYLAIGLSVILAFIGVKLILTFLHEINPDTFPEISTVASLVVIFAVLTITTVASLLAVRLDPTARAHTGAIAGHGPTTTVAEAASVSTGKVNGAGPGAGTGDDASA